MAKLITYAYLRAETDISQQVPDTKLDNPIRRASDRLRELLGVSLYNEIVSQIITTPTSLSTTNAAFFDPYVKQFLAWCAYENFLGRANVAFTGSGVRTYKEEYSDEADPKVMASMLEEARRQTQFYKEAMINYLLTAKRNNSASFPLFTYTDQSDMPGGWGFSSISKNDDSQNRIDTSLLTSEP